MAYIFKVVAKASRAKPKGKPCILWQCVLSDQRGVVLKWRPVWEPHAIPLLHSSWPRLRTLLSAHKAHPCNILKEYLVLDFTLLCPMETQLSTHCFKPRVAQKTSFRLWSLLHSPQQSSSDTNWTVRRCFHTHDSSWSHTLFLHCFSPLVQASNHYKLHFRDQTRNAR